MKVYSNGSSIRKPMMYGGGASMKKMMGGGVANTVGNSMAAGMRKNKMGMMGSAVMRLPMVLPELSSQKRIEELLKKYALISG